MPGRGGGGGGGGRSSGGHSSGRTTYTTGGGGGNSGFGSYVASFAAWTAGLVLGRKISEGMLGGGNKEQQPQSNQSNQPAHVHTKTAQRGDQMNPCAGYQEILLKCLESQDDANSCKWANDMYKECKADMAQPPRNYNNRDT